MEQDKKLSNRKNKTLFFSTCLMLVIITLCASCEGVRFANGYVYDANTSLPLDSVLCEVVETNETIYTDINGHYNVDGPFGGCVNECEDMTVVYFKIGYQTKSVRNPGNANIFLSK
jgi:hypothetical protein